MHSIATAFQSAFQSRKSVLLSLLVACGFAPASAQVIDIVGSLTTNEFATYIAPQSYRDWGNEPFLAINPLNPQQIVVSSFAYGSWISRNTAQLWYSTNGGASWGIRFAVPTPIAGDNFFIDDQVYAYDDAGVLHCAMMVLNTAATIDYIYHGSTTNVENSAAWTWNANALPATSPDQPWLAIGGNRLAIAYDEFAAAGGVEQRVAISTNNGATFPASLNMAVGSPGGSPNNSGGSPLNYINPGLRLAADNAGHVFAIYGMATNGNSGVPLMNYRLNRYSGGAGWDFTSTTPDIMGGLAITNGLSRQGDQRPYFFAGGQNALLGNITSIAANTNGSQVYVVFGLTGSNGIGRLYLQRFQPSGTNLVPSAALAFSSTNFNAALPSVAVGTNGAVGVLFDEYDGTNIHVHVAISFDQGQSIRTNIDLYSFTTNGMVLGYGTANHNRLLGDYQYLKPQGNRFYGTFPARGNVTTGANITTNFIDPYYFSILAIDKPVRPALSQPIKNGDSFQFTLNGEADVTYIIQFSTDLQNWTSIATNTAPTATRSITVSAGNARSNYRAVVGQ